MCRVRCIIYCYMKYLICVFDIKHKLVIGNYYREEICDKIVLNYDLRIIFLSWLILCVNVTMSDVNNVVIIL